MPNLFASLKAFIIGVLVSVGVVTTPATLVHVENNGSTPNPPASQRIIAKQTTPSTPMPSAYSATNASNDVSQNNPVPTNSPFPLNGDNYLYVQGAYSYLGQSIKYLFLVPKNGGGFSGSIEGACVATVGGDYEGGNGGKISGKVSGTCSFLLIKYQGLTNFKGYLYPDSKKIEIEIDNSPFGSPLILNYN